MMLKRTAFATIFTILIFSYALPAGAQDTHFSAALQANQNSVEGIITITLPVAGSFIDVTGNVLYAEDRYSITGVGLLVGNEILTGLTGKIGFRPVAGVLRRTGKDSDILAVGFSLQAEYDLSKVYLQRNIPLSLNASVTASPSPLSFEDTDNYFEATAGIDINVLENGAVTAMFRYINIDSDKPVSWKKDDATGYIGFKFKF